MALASALASAAWRWGSASLEDVAGAQAVLGPAGWVDPPMAAAGSWLAALALVLVSPALPPRVGWVAAGASAAVVVAGPGPGDLWVRALAVVLATFAAALVAHRTTGRRWVDPLAVVAGLGALALTAPDARRLIGAPPAALVGEGLAVAAAAAVATAVVLGLRHLRHPTAASGGGGAS